MKRIFSLLLCSLILLTPAFGKGKKKPVYFVLHGCKQDASEFLNDAFFPELVKGKAHIFSPSQSRLRNFDKCWNWYLPTNTFPIPGHELLELYLKFKAFKKVKGLDDHPSYLIGLSAGAAMALNLFACFPKDFKGVALHSGLPFKVSSLIYDINDVVANGPKKSSKELAKNLADCRNNFQDFQDKMVLVFHGTKDNRVSLKNFYALEEQLTLGMDYLDDRKFNSSVGQSLSSKRILSSESYSYLLRTYLFSNRTQMSFYEIEGLAHDWSGGEYRRHRNDPKGPSVTKVILEEFF